MTEMKPCLGFARDFLFAFRWYASTFCWFLLQALFIKERKQCTREVPKPNESSGFYDWPFLMIEIKLCDGLLALQTFRICTCPAIKSRCPLWRFLHPTVCHRSVIVNRNSQLLLKPIWYSIEYSQIWLPLAASFLGLRVWEVVHMGAMFGMTCPAIKSRCPLWHFLHLTLCHLSIEYQSCFRLMPIQFRIFQILNFLLARSQCNWFFTHTDRNILEDFY